MFTLCQLFMSPWFLNAQVFDYSHWMRLADAFPRQYDGWIDRTASFG